MIWYHLVSTIYRGLRDLCVCIVCMLRPGCEYADVLLSEACSRLLRVEALWFAQVQPMCGSLASVRKLQSPHVSCPCICNIFSVPEHPQAPWPSTVSHSSSISGLEPTGGSLCAAIFYRGQTHPIAVVLHTGPGWYFHWFFMVSMPALGHAAHDVKECL